jgi:hypothetical protein
VTFSEQIAFVELEPGACGAVEQRRVERVGTPAGADHPRVSRGGIREVARDELAHLCHAHAGRDHRNAVRDDPAPAVARRAAQILEPRIADESAGFLEIRRTFAVAHRDSFNRP